MEWLDHVALEVRLVGLVWKVRMAQPALLAGPVLPAPLVALETPEQSAWWDQWVRLAYRDRPAPPDPGVVRGSSETVELPAPPDLVAVLDRPVREVPWAAEARQDRPVHGDWSALPVYREARVALGSPDDRDKPEVRGRLEVREAEETPVERGGREIKVRVVRRVV